MPDVSGTAPPALEGSRYVVAAYGYDDITLGFDLTGSAISLKRVAEMPGREFGMTKRLGYDGAWGKFENLLGRSYATFKRDTNRLYVQWKPVDEGELLRPSDFARQFHALEQRMAVVGLESFERQWVTRVDVSVDLECPPADGKMLLDALEATRLPGGKRVTVDGQPPRRCTSGRGRQTTFSPALTVAT